MKNIIGLKEFRQNATNYIAEIKKGKFFIVVKRSKPVFKISSPELEEEWETIADFTEIKKGGVALNKLLSRL